MKNLILFFLSIFSFSASATEIYVGTVQRAVGSAHTLEGQPCQVEIYQRDKNHAIFLFSAGSQGQYKSIFKATREALIGIENLNSDLAYTGPEVKVPGSWRLRQDRLVIQLSDEGSIRIKAKKLEWEPNSFYSADLFSFVCKANRQ